MALHLTARILSPLDKCLQVVYIRGGHITGVECVSPDPDGILDLSSLCLLSISLQGVPGLVHEDTSKTKQTWEATKALLLAALRSEGLEALGSKLSPLQIEGVPEPVEGRCLPLSCKSSAAVRLAISV